MVFPGMPAVLILYFAHASVMREQLPDTCFVRSWLLPEDSTEVCRQVGNTSPWGTRLFRINLSCGFIQPVKPQLA